MLVAGAVLGGLGMLFKVWTTVNAAQARRDPEVAPLEVLWAGSILYTPFIATGLGLTGAGMGRRGHFDAHGQLFEGREPRHKRRAILGWSLFGGGMAIWTATRLAQAACGGADCRFRTLETGYYLSLLGTVPGIVMGSYGSGFASYHRRHKGLADLSAAPLIGRDMRGLSISARF